MKERVSAWAGSVDSFSLSCLADAKAEAAGISTADARIELARQAVVLDIESDQLRENAEGTAKKRKEVMSDLNQ